MSIPESWRNVAIGMKLVRKGQKISVEVSSGGWIGAESPVDGVVVEAANGSSVFIPKIVVGGVDGSAMVVGSKDGPLAEAEDELPVVECGVKGCGATSDEVDFEGSICRPCWCFCSGEDGGDDSQARRNANTAAMRRKRSNGG